MLHDLKNQIWDYLHIFIICKLYGTKNGEIFRKRRNKKKMESKINNQRFRMTHVNVEILCCIIWIIFGLWMHQKIWSLQVIFERRKKKIFRNRTNALIMSGFRLNGKRINFKILLLQTEHMLEEKVIKVLIWICSFVLVWNTKNIGFKKQIVYNAKIIDAHSIDLKNEFIQRNNRFNVQELLSTIQINDLDIKVTKNRDISSGIIMWYGVQHYWINLEIDEFDTVQKMQ